MKSVSSYGATLSRSAAEARPRVMGSSGRPSTSPLTAGSCSQGLRFRAATAFNTSHRAGRSKSFPCITSVAFTCSIMWSGFDSEADILPETTTSCLNILGVMHPAGWYGAMAGSAIAGSANSGLGHSQVRLLSTVPTMGRAVQPSGNAEPQTPHICCWRLTYVAPQVLMLTLGKAAADARSAVLQFPTGVKVTLWSNNCAAPC
mmetsp:Transcript_44721/g.132038  ORF Transcript_44721/g.132038 Transcript_44721/m.132038 type:complete len:203 (+) Transcript_44721:457-1065(+)